MIESFSSMLGNRLLCTTRARPLHRTRVGRCRSLAVVGSCKQLCSVVATPSTDQVVAVACTGVHTLLVEGRYH